MFFWEEEDDAWAIQGPYAHAIENREAAKFIEDENGRPVFWILGVSDFLYFDSLYLFPNLFNLGSIYQSP